MPSPLGLKPDRRVCCPVPDFPAYQCYWPTGLTLARIRALNGGAGRSTGAGRIRIHAGAPYRDIPTSKGALATATVRKPRCLLLAVKGHMARQVSSLGLLRR